MPEQPIGPSPMTGVPVARSPNRAVHAAGILLLVVLVSWASAGLMGRPFWPPTAFQVAVILCWALGLHAILLVAARLTRREGAEPWVGYVATVATLVHYFTPDRVGPIDAQWYGQMMADFLAQSRAGTFPVVTGTTVFAFNGAVHPFRSAPWQYVLAWGLDPLVGRMLAPLALEHLTAIASFFAAVLTLFVGLARSRPGLSSAALLFSLVYATMPSFTASFIQHDMYMTLVAAPAMVALLICVQRVIDCDSMPAYGWAGVSAAALWYCHPPMALMMCLVAGFCVVSHLALCGLTLRRAVLSALALALFAALALPYFRSMAEISLAVPDPVPDIAIPAIGLALLAFSAGGLFRSGSILWVAPLPIAWLCFREFKPSFVPLTYVFAIGACVVGAAGPRFKGLRVSSCRDLWLIGLALVSALVAVACFAAASLPAVNWISDYVLGSAAKWRNFFSPIAMGRIYDQPGYLGWFLLGTIAVLSALTRSAFARIGLACAFVLVCALGFAGKLSLFLWLNCPREFIDVVGVAYDLRILPVLAPLTVVAAYAWYVGMKDDHPGLARAFVITVLAFLPWTLFQDGVLVATSGAYRIDAGNTANRFRTENVMLQRYSWDLLVTPRFFSHGVMDPAIESRFWRFGDAKRAEIDPDAIERALEAPGQRPVPLMPTQLPTGPEWLSLAPRLELDPGQKELIRFDFLGKDENAWLILRGQRIYREYILPSSGTSFSFGSDATNGRTISLWNSGDTHESIEVLVLREGPGRTRAPGPGPYYLAYVTPFDPARAPVELYSLSPVHLRVTAPSDGYLETFRSFIPGYKVYVDGKQETVRVSGNRLVSVWLKKGTHDVRVRFAGTVSLHTDERWAIAAWLVALAAMVVQIILACRVPTGKAADA
jgi:hypothetical protein